MDLVVIDSIEKAEKLNDPALDDCPPHDESSGEICISLNSGYAEYTYLANTVPAYLADEYGEQLKQLVVIGRTGHYGQLSKSQIDVSALAKLGRLKNRLYIESWAPIYSYSIASDNYRQREYIVDFGFINENELSKFLQELPADAHECTSKKEAECWGWGESWEKNALKNPGAYVNSDGDVCYGQALFLDALLPSPSNQSNKAQPSAAGTH